MSDDKFSTGAQQTRSAYARVLAAQGLTVDQIAEQTGLRPYLVRKALGSSGKPGPRKKKLEVWDQLLMVERLVEDAPNERSRVLATQLFEELSCVWWGRQKSTRPGGS